MKQPKQFKDKIEAKKYAIRCLKRIANLCEELGISFWHGEEADWDDLYIRWNDGADSYDLNIYGGPKLRDTATLTEWLRVHIKHMEEEVKPANEDR